MNDHDLFLDDRIAELLQIRSLLHSGLYDNAIDCADLAYERISRHRDEGGVPLTVESKEFGNDCRIVIAPSFAAELRVGDEIVMIGEGEDWPWWFISADIPERLYDQCIRIDTLTFMGARGEEHLKLLGIVCIAATHFSLT